MVYKAKHSTYERVMRRLVQVGECREFPGATFWDGYGMVADWSTGKQITKRTHRVVWEHHHGPIPTGLMVLHRCDNRRCCEIGHLFLGTNTDNMRDAVSKGRLRGSGWVKRTRNARGQFS